MKELEKEFVGKGEVRGFRFTQIKKNQFAYLYEVTAFKNVWYEVFHHKENNRYNCVSYPKSKSFGLWAWSISNLFEAIDKFDNISIAKEAKNG